ncbi:MAG: glycosyltransferase [Anaerolineaceae bacterium]|nr:glycosyltransferase [Anaerolineaceae bacterium]
MNAPINILFISSYIDLGGGETALLNLVDNLDHTRYLPHLLVRAEGQLAQAWRKRGWPVYVAPWRGATTYFAPVLWARLPISRCIGKLIREKHIQLVHSDYHTLPMALPAGERNAVPVLWWCWGWWFKPKFWQRAFFHRPAATIALSKAIKAGFLGEPPFMPPEKVKLIYSGVDTQRFQPATDGSQVRIDADVPQNAPLVALLARFQDVKGHDVFQDMARQVAQIVPEAHFVVAGENTQTSADNDYKTRILETAANDPLLKSRLHYLGFRADTERVIAAADVIVCSSHFESYGMVNIEAMASGKPVVSTNQGGPSETVADGVTGYLVPPGDAAGLALQVIALLENAALRTRMGAAGRTRVEELFSVNSMAAEYMRIVEQVLKRS